MTPGTVFALALICLDVGACVAYAIDMDARRSIYWLAAAVLTACVTF